LIYKLNISSVNIQGQVINPGGGTPQSGQYGKAPPERKRVGKIAILVCERVTKSAARWKKRWLQQRISKGATFWQK